jgi:hypothetical protein
MPSMKSETEKPEYSKYVKRPTRIPIAKDIMPIDKIVSSLNSIFYTLFSNWLISIKILGLVGLNFNPVQVNPV